MGHANIFSNYADAGDGGRGIERHGLQCCYLPILVLCYGTDANCRPSTDGLHKNSNPVQPQLSFDYPATPLIGPDLSSSIIEYQGAVFPPRHRRHHTLLSLRLSSLPFPHSTSSSSIMFALRTAAPRALRGNFIPNRHDEIPH